jgi:hypothetical protein
VQGRAYIQRERQIVKLTKVMVQENEEVEAFRDLLKELDTANLESPTRDFWLTVRELAEAMEEQVRQGRERLAKEAREGNVQKADVADSAPLDSSQGASEDPLAQRVHRMEMILRETEGMRTPMMMGEQSLIARYRVLVGEFHSLLQSEVDEMQAEIDALKEMQRDAR